MKKKPSLKVQIIVADYYKDIASSLTESAIKVLKINKIDFNVIYVRCLRNTSVNKMEYKEQ